MAAPATTGLSSPNAASGRQTVEKAASTPWLLIIIFIVLGLAGAVLLVVARSRGRAAPAAA